jgi:hypothetical protein
VEIVDFGKFPRDFGCIYIADYPGKDSAQEQIK